MQITSDHLIDGDVRERAFVVDGVPGILWTPASAVDTPVPLILMGHPGGLGPMYPRFAARALSAARQGFASATIELPGAGERAPLSDVAAARDDLRRVLADGERPDDDIIDRLVLPLVDQAVPEWQRTLDALQTLPEIGDRIGYSGGVLAIGVRLALVEPRITAAGLFAGSYVPRVTFDEARRIRIPLHVLLQWDDEGNDRQMALDLFDAFGSAEKTLQANMGGHRGVPAHAGDDAARFFARHLGGPEAP